MSFTNPWLFAAGVACLAIPVWVHLQRRRQPRRVVFSTNRFIDPSELSTRKKRSIQDWPLFLLRCLAACLANYSKQFELHSWFWNC